MIESVSFSGGPSVTIKSHHNVGGLPERMNLKLVEPLRELFKDEVRALGRELGLPAAFVGRHPFPGPGLAIRCPGEITRDKLAILRKADAIYLDEIRRHGLYDAIWQAFAVLLPVRSVGVMGDGRTYDHVCALRAVTSVDGMTADCYPFDHAFLGRDRHPDHQRGQGHQPRRLRHHLEAARHDRVGVSAPKLVLPRLRLQPADHHRAHRLLADRVVADARDRALDHLVQRVVVGEFAALGARQRAPELGFQRPDQAVPHLRVVRKAGHLDPGVAERAAALRR